MTGRVPLAKCQRHLLTTWLLGLVPTVLLMSSRSLTGGFYGSEQAAWSWFVPMFLPTISLMIGAYSSIAIKEPISSASVDRTFFQVSLSCSIFYLAILFSVVLYQPFANSPALETFSRSSVFLSVIQGVATGCIGVFFASQKQG